MRGLGGGRREKGKFVAPKREKESSAPQKRKRKRTEPLLWSNSTRQPPDRAHAPMHGTTRNGWTPPTPTNKIFWKSGIRKNPLRHVRGGLLQRFSSDKYVRNQCPENNENSWNLKTWPPNKQKYSSGQFFPSFRKQATCLARNDMEFRSLSSQMIFKF